LPKVPKLLYLFLISSIFVVEAFTQQPVASAPAHVKRAELLLGKGDIAGAIDSYGEAIKLNPGWAKIYLRRGLALRVHGALDKAIEDFDKATALDPRTTRNDRAVAQAYNNHGQIHMTNLRPDEAILDFEKALRINPTDSRPYFDRGEARILNEDFAGAIEDFDSYLTMEKAAGSFGKSLALADRSLAKHLLGHDDDAKKDLASIGGLSPELKQAVLLHIGELEARMMILRHLRSQQKKAIA
jgi:tetratricopeptide (TPR) repeat protein